MSEPTKFEIIRTRFELKDGFWWCDLVLTCDQGTVGNIPYLVGAAGEDPAEAMTNALRNWRPPNE